MKVGVEVSASCLVDEIGALTRATARIVGCNGDAVLAMGALASAIAVFGNVVRTAGQSETDLAASILLTALVHAAVELGAGRDDLLAKVGAGFDGLNARLAACEAECRAATAGVH